MQATTATATQNVETLSPEEFARQRTNLSSKFSKRKKAAEKQGITVEEYCQNKGDWEELQEMLKQFEVGPFKVSKTNSENAVNASDARGTSTAKTTRPKKAAKIPTNQRLDQLMDDIDISVVDMQSTQNDVNLFPAISTGTVFDKIASNKGGFKLGTTYIVPGESGSGKTSVTTAIAVNIIKTNPEMREQVGFLSAEMQLQDWAEECSENEVLDILPIVYMKKALRDVQDEMFLATLKKMFRTFRIAVIDSFEVIKAKISENTALSSRDAENWLLSTFEDLNEEGHAFIVIQHMNKSGEYTGSTRVKHDPTGMMLVKFDTEGNRYVMFSKNRRGGGMVNKPLYFTKDKTTGEIVFDEARFELAERGTLFGDTAEDKLQDDENWLEAEFTRISQQEKETNNQENSNEDEVDQQALQEMQQAAEVAIDL